VIIREKVMSFVVEISRPCAILASLNFSSGGKLGILAGSAHRDGDVVRANADLKRFLDGSAHRWRQPGVVYTTFHHMFTRANVVTTEYSDWATGCPEYKVTAVQVSPARKLSEWQKQYLDSRKQTTQVAAEAVAVSK
jgi:predicted molibdopterin-dependent oxidoreductase YjgC